MSSEERVYVFGREGACLHKRGCLSSSLSDEQKERKNCLQPFFMLFCNIRFINPLPPNFKKIYHTQLLSVSTYASSLRYHYDEWMLNLPNFVQPEVHVFGREGACLWKRGCMSSSLSDEQKERKKMFTNFLSFSEMETKLGIIALIVWGLGVQRLNKNKLSSFYFQFCQNNASHKIENIMNISYFE